ncbi:uncharacterized protein LOC111335083 isoform X2 [Stylophora pistillata]|nr:uncharacterized protein LOC111335083 isoform X2 [Stylophora pistillata]
MKNIELKDEVDRTSRTVESQERQIEALQSLIEETDNPTLLRKSKSLLRRKWKSALIIVLLLALAVVIPLLYVSKSKSSSFVPSESSQSSQNKALNLQMPLGQGKDGKASFNFGVRLDNLLQDCQNPHWKRSFPDLDYAVFGYDILKGYPLATGHDPGFTHPIFVTDYTSEKQTSDCRYSVPAGLIVVPDVSCETSFSSKVVRNRLEMSKSLEASANIEGGGWGFKFSASASYKESVAQMSSGEYLYVISQAQCRYYFSKMDDTDPPPFDPGFVSWAKRLSNSNGNGDAVLEFIQYYGTHYLTEVTFGARFMKNHKMSQTKYTELRSQKISVEAQASYSGVDSIGGGFSMDSEQRSAVSNFQKSVETSTITVGAAPPSNGDAMTWASSVQENPVPIRFTLRAIHNLFTERYSKHLPDVNLDVMREMIINSSKNYCQALKLAGRVDSCDDDINLGIELQNIGVATFGYRYLGKVDETDCRAICLLDEKCVAVQYSAWRGCKLFDTKKDLTAGETTNSKLVVFLSRLHRLKESFVLKHLKVKEIEQRRGEKQSANVSECSLFCAEDAFCQAFVMCDPKISGSWCKNAKGNCLLYSKQKSTAVEINEYSEIHYVWKNYTLAEEPVN